MNATKSQRLVGLFLVALTLLNFPLLGLWQHPRLVGGFPPLFSYLFLIWMGLILVLRHLADSPSPPSSKT